MNAVFRFIVMWAVIITLNGIIVWMSEKVAIIAYFSSIIITMLLCFFKALKKEDKKDE